MLAAAATAAGLLALLRRGALTIDLRIGRSSRPLGPITTAIDAPREVVFDVVALLYSAARVRALPEKLRVLERVTDIVLAEHVNDVGRFLTTTLETV